MTKRKPTSAKDFANLDHVMIGKQVWTTKNLDVVHYRNGDPIPEIRDSQEWARATTGAWCNYHNDPEVGAKYGKLYNWHAVNDKRGLAPKGWHVPDDMEWEELLNLLGEDAHLNDLDYLRRIERVYKSAVEHQVKGLEFGMLPPPLWNRSYGETVTASKLFETTGWGTNGDSGFSALRGGYRDSSYRDSLWANVCYDSLWWSSSERSAWESSMFFQWGIEGEVWYIQVWSDNTWQWRSRNKQRGCSVRCVRDSRSVQR